MVLKSSVIGRRATFDAREFHGELKVLTFQGGKIPNAPISTQRALGAEQPRPPAFSGFVLVVERHRIVMISSLFVLTVFHVLVLATPATVTQCRPPKMSRGNHTLQLRS